MSDNPFNITKAVDFTDQQIKDTWVDLPETGGFLELVAPASQMPMILIGGKGCGRTHIMRYFSYPLQKLRAGERGVLEGVRREGYVGVYFRCEGLNAGRFDAKGQSSEVWDAIFAYHMDLWLAQLVLGTIQDLLRGCDSFKKVEASFCHDVVDLFDQHDFGDPRTLAELIATIRRLQREIDVAVNNVALTRRLQVIVRETRGRLVFGIPTAMQTQVPELAEVRVVYLIDELENLTVSQQRYVNTLIREKQPPVSFKVGSRRHGLRTLQTLSAGEENRAGSEYEPLPLDDHFRAGDERYPAFARRLVARRLEAAGHMATSKSPGGGSVASDEELEKALSGCFETVADDDFDRAATQFVEQNYQAADRPHLQNFRRKLDAAWPKRLAPGVNGARDVETILGLVAVDKYPLLEKTNVYLMYKDWSARRDLLTAARSIHSSCRAYMSGRDEEGARHRMTLKLFRGDLIAQLLREGKQRQRYVGLNTFIDMSFGLPRNLMIVLKCVYKWAVFNGERPFQGAPISIQSQQDGVLQAANWFFEDSRSAGENAQVVQDGVDRLSNFFHKLRFSDKPVESSLVTFGFVESEASAAARANIRSAYESSLLVKVPGGHKERNTARVVEKYQLNPMLSPRYDLPLGRRGVVELKPREVNAIFDQSCTPDFTDIVRMRLERMNAPFLGRGADDGGSDDGSDGPSGTLLLPGIL